MNILILAQGYFELLVTANFERADSGLQSEVTYKMGLYYPFYT